MKKPAALLAAIIAAAIAIIAIYHYFPKSKETQYASIEHNEGEEGEEHELQSGAAHQLSTSFQHKAYPDPTNLSVKYQRGWEQHLENIRKAQYNNTRIQAANWTSLGYCQDAGVRIGGRVVCLAIDPSNNNNLWAGSASGGIWRSTNAGTSWTAVTTNLPILGVSSIIVDPTNSSIIYAGTGEVYNTVITDAGNGNNVWKTRGTYGIGIIKSVDGGVNWTQTLVKDTSDLFAVQSLAIRTGAGNNDTIYACATDGLYRSLDAGGSWNVVYAASNVRDIAINPVDPDQVVLSIGNMTNATKGIYRSTNAKSASPTFAQVTTGLPASYEGHIKLDNVGSGELFASIGMSSSTASSNREIYRSTNFGSSWSVVGGTTSGTTTNHCSYQFWFAHTVAINPFDTDSIMFGGVGIYRYDVSSTTRTTIGGLHADHHDIKFDPINRGRVYVCNDGGVYKSTNGGQTFTAINTGLNATQFYASLGVSKQNANIMIGGLQDNGQVLYNGTTWNSISWGGGDGTSCAIHPTNDQIMLASRDAKQIFRTANGGGSGGSVTSYWGFVGDSRTGFVAPIAFSPSAPATVYLASDNIHVSTNSGASFSNNALGATPPYPATTPSNYIEQRHKTAVALAVAPTNPNLVYVSTSPYAQYDNDVSNIYVTGTPNLLKSNGTNAATVPYTSIKGTLPNRFVTDIAVSNFSNDSLYVTLGGFGSSHVYLSPDGGTTWLSRGAGLPDVPFNAILIDPDNPGTIYAGCDFGVYVSPDKGLNWIAYSTGFWDATMIMDLQLDANEKLIAATHGKGVFRSDLYIHIATPVTLLDFAGAAMPNHNELKWTVEQETDLSRYELERSSDGINFSRIATIQSRNQAVQSVYNYNDLTMPFESYYRLKMIDRDGTFTYSTVVFLRRPAGKPEFSVLGNPFQGVIVLKYKLSNDQKIVASLFNATGGLIRREQYAATAGIGVYTIGGFEAIAGGVYYLRVESGDVKQTIKLIKN